MKAIVTRYHGATNFKPSRMSAKAEGVPTIFVSYDHDLDSVGNHAAAAKALKAKYKWQGTMYGGGLPNGDMSWVFHSGADYEINPKRRKNPIGRMTTKADFQEEAAFILDTLAGKLPLDSFNGEWDVFARYADMQSGQAKRAGFADIADVMKAAANRAKRKTRRGNPSTRDGGRERYIRRPSQITKKKPVKRLKKRRAKNWDRPTKGRFPNPAPRGFVIYAKGTGKRMNFDGTKFSEREPKLFGNARAAEGAAMNMMAKFPVLKKYKIWVAPESAPPK